MRKHIIAIIYLFLSILYVQASTKMLILKSPNGKKSIQVTLTDQGKLIYSVKYKNETVIENSSLGVETSLGNFTQNLKIKEIKPIKKQTETYSAPAEKRTSRKFTAKQTSIILQNAENKSLQLDLKATNDGVAFRYVLNDENPITVKKENSSFKFNAATKAWLHPNAVVKTGWAETQPSYEEQYEYEIPVGTPSVLGVGWTFPALFKTGNNWALITEAGLTPNYCGSHLSHLSQEGEYSIAFAQKGETVRLEDSEFPISKNIVTPWRAIVFGALQDVVESQMVTDLSAPVDAKKDFSWVKPGIASWSWGVLHDESVNYETTKEFIDYASKMTWNYCLIDADWDRKIGYERIKELADDAKAKNVGLILWYNSSGSWNSTVYSPKNALLEREARRKEFERIQKMGIAGIKVDFWPGDGQSSIQYYYDMMSDAADYKLLLNFHGTTVPRGWSRTFPNLMSMESIRGFEFTTFEQKDTDKAPKHLTMMPFARNVVGPMDFTPVCFGEIRGKKRRTSNGFELALSVVLQSGISHFVEIPTSMEKQPDYVKDFMKNVPRSWDDIKLLDGFPGKYIVTARKSGGKWYVGGINSHNETLHLKLDLSKLNCKNNLTEVTLITDGETNRTFSRRELQISKKMVELDVKPNGGFVFVY